MASSYSRRIRERIEQAPEGTLFINSDFTDIAGAETVRRNLNRLIQTGTLRRILKGIYEKPEYSEFLHEYVAVSPDAVAKTLAREYHWTIAPCGDKALNLLGLSTQVPAVWLYISDGPNRIYKWYSTNRWSPTNGWESTNGWKATQLELRHVASREITGFSYLTALVFHALKTMGKEYVTPETIRYLRRHLNDEQKVSLLEEAAESTDWIYDVIRQIAQEA